MQWVLIETSCGDTACADSLTLIKAELAHSGGVSTLVLSAAPHRAGGRMSRSMWRSKHHRNYFFGTYQINSVAPNASTELLKSRSAMVVSSRVITHTRSDPEDCVTDYDLAAGESVPRYTGQYLTHLPEVERTTANG